MPSSGLLLVNEKDENLSATLKLGCWSSVENFTLQKKRMLSNKGWVARTNNEHDGTQFDCITPEGDVHPVTWKMNGRHNILNALGAIAAAHHAGVPVEVSAEALSGFKGIKRRMELIGNEFGVCVYDDFAHHPTAVKSTLLGLRARVGHQKIYALLEMRSNTMRMGYHKENILNALKTADFAVIYVPENSALEELKEAVLNEPSGTIVMMDSVDKIVERLNGIIGNDEHVVIMSNGSFQGLHSKVINMLTEQ